MKQKTTHTVQLAALRRIEGQVKGVQRMIEKEEYCIDIVNQIHASINALYRVAEKILHTHIESCVVDTFRGKAEKNKKKKIEELIGVVQKLHRL
ncbi:MAG: metal-sensitive transcriptional regulator [Candidatus Omnitrophica bacterium]|nr:metal-sensitive transcriptional regulator [Candidatus Omnitrophota bacterium]